MTDADTATGPKKKWKNWLEDEADLLFLFPDESDREILGREWDPTKADREAAWKLLTEMRLRIATQQLRYTDGDEGTALSSLAGLFGFARKTLSDAGPEASHAALLIDRILNSELRPLTARWHPLAKSGQLERQDNRRVFRQELLEVRTQLLRCMKGLGRLAQDGGDFAADVEVREIQAEGCKLDMGSLELPAGEQFLGPPLAGKPDAAQSQAIPEVADTSGARWLCEAERNWIKKRRAAAYPKLPQEQKHGALGATEEGDESLGAVGLSLSGGGIRSATFCLGVLQGMERNGLLRGADYLSTVSGGGYTGAFLSSWMSQGRSLEEVLLPPSKGGSDSVFVRWLRNNSKYLLSRGWLARLGTVALVVGRMLPSFALLVGTLSILVGLGLLLGALAIHVGATLPLWIGYIPGLIALLVGLLLVIPAVLRQLNVNDTSLHHLYRDRLASCYLASGKQAEPDPTHDPRSLERSQSKLSELTPEHGAPYHLVNCVVNLPSSEHIELRGRRSDFFWFSPHHSGAPLTGFVPTTALESSQRNGDDHLDLGTAMAISGAAVSSHMGLVGNAWLAPLCTFFNVRLGYWFPNPKNWKDDPENGSAAGEPGLLHWFREFWGGPKFDEEQPLVNITDGGHIENLGLYELLRRRCKLIFCIDGGADAKGNLAEINHCQRLAAIDLGVHLNLDLRELRTNWEGHTQSHFALGTIDYNPYRKEGEDAQIGYLVYLKLSVTGNEPNYVLDYRRRNKHFPHSSILDQLFDEDQFEAFRALGEHVANELVRPELFGGKDKVPDPEAPLYLRRWLEGFVHEVLRPELERPVRDEA